MQTKHITTLAILLLAFSTHAQQAADCTISLDTIYAQVFKHYEASPLQAIGWLRLVPAQAAKGCPAATLLKVGEAYLNMGSLYDEQLEEPDSASVYLSKSYEAFLLSADSVKAYNVLKYLGLITCKAGDCDAGEQQINISLSYFHRGEMWPLYYVAKRNLAKLFELKGDLHAAQAALEESLDFWIGQHDLRRAKLYYEDLEAICSKQFVEGAEGCSMERYEMLKIKED